MWISPKDSLTLTHCNGNTDADTDAEVVRALASEVLSSNPATAVWLHSNTLKQGMQWRMQWGQGREPLGPKFFHFHAVSDNNFAK